MASERDRQIQRLLEPRFGTGKVRVTSRRIKKNEPMETLEIHILVPPPHHDPQVLTMISNAGIKLAYKNTVLWDSGKSWVWWHGGGGVCAIAPTMPPRRWSGFSPARRLRK